MGLTTFLSPLISASHQPEELQFEEIRQSCFFFPSPPLSAPFRRSLFAYFFWTVPSSDHFRSSIQLTLTTMFEKTLKDVVKGIRASKRDATMFISQCIADIKTEISSSDMFVKANALQKLTFLQMMGYSMNWASFQTIEVMSSPRFYHKRIGYLAAVRFVSVAVVGVELTSSSRVKDSLRTQK